MPTYSPDLSRDFLTIRPFRPLDFFRVMGWWLDLSPVLQISHETSLLSDHFGPLDLFRVDKDSSGPHSNFLWFIENRRTLNYTCGWNPTLAEKNTLVSLKWKLFFWTDFCWEEYLWSHEEVTSILWNTLVSLKWKLFYEPTFVEKNISDLMTIFEEHSCVT